MIVRSRHLLVMSLLGALMGCQAPVPPVLPGSSFTLPRADLGPVAPGPSQVLPESLPTTGEFHDAPTPFVSPASTPTPSSGGGGRGNAPVPLTGTVVALSDDRETPLAGARVLLTDGREVVSDAEGRFAFSGRPPQDGTVITSASGYVSSVVVGLEGAPVTVHLRPKENVSAEPSEDEPLVFEARGQVLSPAGAPLSDLIVLMEGPDGTTSSPAGTDEDGRFVLEVETGPDGVRNGTLLVVGANGREWLAVRTGLVVTPAAPELAPVVAQPASHPVRLTVDSPVAFPQTSAWLELVGPGASLSLPAIAGVTQVAAVPQATFVARVLAEDPDEGTLSEYRLEPVTFDERTAGTTVTATLLAPPTAEPTADGLKWGAIAGARGYQLSATALDQGLQVWEAFTTRTSLSLSSLASPPRDGFRFTLTAWDQPGAGARQVAAVSEARPLRLLPVSTSFRRASRRFRLP